MPSVSPLRCNQTTGLSTATFRDCRSVSFSVLAAMATAAHRAAITVSAVTLKHSKPHYQPDSHAAPSESLWKSNNPARRRETQPETEWNEQAQAVQLSPDEKTLPQLVEKKVVCCCLFLLNFAVKGGFQCTCSKRVASLRVLKPAIQTTPTDCV